MTRQIAAVPLTPERFTPFGEVIDASGKPDKIINQGLCRRFHDRAQMEFVDGRAGISVFEADTRSLPLTLEMMERHPEGTQAFLPMTLAPFLVVVAPDEAGRPGQPHAFLTAPGQGVNYDRYTWHGVLTPLSAPGLFAVIDRIGPGANLEEHWFDTPWIITGGPD